MTKPEWFRVAALPIVLIVLGLAGLVVLLTGDAAMLSSLLSVSVVLAALFGVQRRLAPPLLSPVVLVTGGLVATAVFGLWFYGDVQSAAGGASALIVLSPDETTKTFRLILESAASLLVGASVVTAVLPKMELRPSFPPGQRRRPLPILLPICLMPVVVVVLGYGTDYLWRRDSYIDVTLTQGGLRGAAIQLAVGAVLALGYLARSTTGLLRVGALLGAFTYLAVFFSLGSRRMALFPLLFAAGFYLAARTRKGLALLIAGSLVSLYLIKLPLYLRGLPSHGFEPYWSSLPGFLSYQAPWSSVFRNLLVSFGIIGATAYRQPSLNLDVLWISLNPAPGGWVGWYDIAPALRLNYYTPYAGIGELGNYGHLANFFYFAVAGMILVAFDRQILRLASAGRLMVGMSLLGLSGLFLLYSIQYNLRTSTRMLLYGGALSVTLELYQRLRGRQGMAHPGPAQSGGPASAPVANWSIR